MRVVAEVIFTLCEPHRVDTIDQGLKRPMKFPPGEWRAKAMMFAGSKCHVSAGPRAIQIQSIRIIKPTFVAIRCGETDIDLSIIHI